MNIPPDLLEKIRAAPVLTRKISVADRERGRAARRAFADWINKGQPLRRAERDPRKDVLLRQRNSGERRLPFRPLEESVPCSRP